MKTVLINNTLINLQGFLEAHYDPKKSFVVINLGTRKYDVEVRNEDHALKILARIQTALMGV